MSEGKRTKKHQTYQWLREHNIHHWGACPHCHSGLTIDQYSLVCINGHRFDSSKQGYFNLTTKQLAPSKYDVELFKARRVIITESTLYHKLHIFLIELIKKISAKVIIDAGSGEGSHLATIVKAIPDPITALALDLSKPGIQLSTDYNELMFSVVSDLANMPLQEGKADVIISFLSPANYEEFNRILKEQGIIIKIIPNTGYLKEIRAVLKMQGIKQIDEYNNDRVIEVFKRHYPHFKQYSIKDRVLLTDEQLKQLLRMTPLVWDLSEVEKEQLFTELPNEITLDVTVLISNGKIDFINE